MPGPKSGNCDMETAPQFAAGGLFPAGLLLPAAAEDEEDDEDELLLVCFVLFPPPS